MNLSLKNKKILIIIAGPTAVGKTQLSIDLALELDTEIVSCDSRQLYHETSIGTAKPSFEELEKVKHHFINHVSIHDSFTVGDYERECDDLLTELFSTKNQVILTGGTGLYIKAVIEGLDKFPKVDEKNVHYYEQLYNQYGIAGLQKELEILDYKYYQKVDKANSRRLIRALSVIKQSNKSYSSFLEVKEKELPFQVLYFVLERDRKVLYDRINQRVDLMIEDGLLDEAKSLLKFQNNRSLQTVGYQELFKFLNGEWSLEFAIEKIKQHSRNYAKRQITWFKKIENKIVLDANDLDLDIIIKHIK